MNKQTIRLMLCAVLWTGATALMIGGTFRHSVVVMGWGGFSALMACMMTGWVVADCAAQTACRDERLSVEALGELIAAKAVERMAHEDVTRIR